jgi:hypothetical protein
MARASIKAILTSDARPCRTFWTGLGTEILLIYPAYSSAAYDGRFIPPVHRRRNCPRQRNAIGNLGRTCSRFKFKADRPDKWALNPCGIRTAALTNLEALNDISLVGTLV